MGLPYIHTYVAIRFHFPRRGKYPFKGLVAYAFGRRSLPPGNVLLCDASNADEC